MKRIGELSFALGLAVLVPQIQSAQTIQFAPPRQVSIGGTNNAVGEPLVGDFDNDGKTDLLVAVGLQPAPRHLNVLFGDGDGGFSIVESNSITNAMSPLLVADVNGDGKSDVIMVTIGCCAGSDSVLSVLLGDGKGHFTAGAQYSVPYGIYQGLVADFNKDGHTDFVLNVINEDPRATPPYVDQILFKGHGDGTFTMSALNLTSEAAIRDGAIPFIGDFNGDGSLDLAFVDDDVPSGSQAIHVAFGHGDGTFSSLQLSYVTDTVSVGMPSAANFNGDRKSDIVLSLMAKGTPGAQPRIVSLLAKQTQGFYWASALSLPILGYATVSDLNGDGKPDLIAYGNDYRSVSTGSTPLYLWIYGGLSTGAFGPKSIVNVSSISSLIPTNLLTVPLRRGDLPSIFVVDASEAKGLQVLVNITK